MMIKKIISIIGITSVLIFSTKQIQAQSLSDQEAGEKFYQMVRQQLPLVSDPLITDYIRNIGYRLVSYSETPEDPFHFFVIKSNVINAFAGPAGYIGVYGGLITATKTESELASVMAHEIAHVSQDHLKRGADKMSNLTIPAIAAMVAAIAAGNTAVAVGSVSAVTAGVTQYSINTTRTYEEEADSIGIQTLARAGFNPYGMADFFGKLQEQSRYDTEPPPFLLTHPVTQERLAEATERAKKLSKKKHYTSSDTYYLVKARMQFELATNSRDFLNQAKDAQKKSPNSLYTNYLLALAYIKNQEYAKADQQLQQLEQQYKNNIILPYTQAQAAYAAKNYAQAVKFLISIHNNNPDYYPVNIFYASCLIRNKQYKQALDLLREYQTDYAESPDYWSTLSRAYAKNNNLIYAYISRSKAYQLLGDTKNAILQLQMAAQQPKQTAYTTALVSAEIKRLTKESNRK